MGREVPLDILHLPAHCRNVPVTFTLCRRPLALGRRFNTGCTFTLSPFARALPSFAARAQVHRLERPSV
jgi:hypothetical protein